MIHRTSAISTPPAPPSCPLSPSFLHPTLDSRLTIGTTLQWSRARPGPCRVAGQVPRYDEEMDQGICSYNSRCPRMTGVRSSQLIGENYKPISGSLESCIGFFFPYQLTGRSEIILSKLDLDNTSERTCVTLIVPLFCVLCLALLTLCWLTFN
jgi:hypothetical protein